MSKAISKKYKCDPWKKTLDGNEHVQIDIDRLIGFMERDCEHLRDGIKAGYFKGMEASALSQIDAYEGLLGMMKANSFK